MNKDSLPISIKLIGWSTIIIGTIGGISAIALVSKMSSNPEIFSVIKYNFIPGFSLGAFESMILSFLYSIFLVISSIFLLKSNQTAWVLTIIAVILGMVYSVAQLITQGKISSLIPLTVGVIMLWKLYEHRNLFLIKNNA